MDIYWFVWEVIINIVDTSFLTYLFIKQLGINKDKRKFMYIGILFIITSISIFNYYNPDFYVPITTDFTIYASKLFFTLIYFMFALLVFNGKISVKIMWSLIVMFISYIANFVSTLVLVAINNAKINSFAQFGYDRIICTIVHTITLIILCILLAHIGKGNRHKMVIPIKIQYLFIVMVTLGAITVDILIDNLYIKSNNTMILNVGELIISIVFIAVISSVFILVMHIGILTNKNMEYILEEQRLKLEREAFENMSVAIEEIREVKHDINHHVQVMQGFLGNNDIKSLSNYFKKVTGNYEEKITMIFLSDPVINNLLYSKFMVMKKHNISFVYKFLETQSMPGDTLDLCSVLGNLLDNAIEACIKISDKRIIWLFIRKRAEMLVISVQNTCNGNFEIKDGRIISDKVDLGHGHGLNHIKKIVQSYKGNIYIYTENNKFFANIYLPYLQN